MGTGLVQDGFRIGLGLVLGVGGVGLECKGASAGGPCGDLGARGWWPVAGTYML